MNREFMKQARQIIGLTQSELAKKVGVHRSYINKLENGAIPITVEIEMQILHVLTIHGIGDKELAMITEILEARGVIEHDGNTSNSKACK